MDLIFTSHINNYDRAAIHPPVLTSDHGLGLRKWRAAKSTTRPAIPWLNFMKANYDAISAVLAQIDLRVVFKNCRFIDLYWGELYAVLKRMIYAHVPASVQCRSSAIKSLLQEIRAIILLKRKAWRRWKRAPNDATKSTYNALSYECSCIMRRHIAAEEELLLSMNHQQFYKYVTQQLHPTLHDLSLVSDGMSLDSPQKVVQCLSLEFSKNFTATTNDYNYLVLVFTAAAGPQLE